jgi:hypothetical protein
MLKTSFIDSNDYYPVSVCNEFVTIDKRRDPIQSNDYSINTTISRNINNNQAVYQVNQDPTVPSQSLYIESNKAFSGYYNKNDQIEHFYDAATENAPSVEIVSGTTVNIVSLVGGILGILVIILIPIVAFFVMKKK